MREFIWAAHLLLLLNIFASGFVDAAGNAQNASSSSKSVDSSVKKGSLADLIAMERIKEQENSSVVKETLAELIAMERIKEQENSSVVKETLAELIAMERIKEQENSSVVKETLAELIAMERIKEQEHSSVVKGTLAELIAMEQIDDKEFDEFVQELRENEHLIRAVFPPQQSFKQVQTQKEEKGMLHTIFKILGEKKEDKKTALEQKYRKLKGIKQNDPALSQIMEKLLMYTENIKSERILKPELKEYLYFTIQFVAKRQQIPLSDIVPFKQMDKKRSLAKLVKLFLEEKVKRHRKGQNEDKNGQKSNSKKDKSNEKSKQEKTLRLLLTAMDDGNGIGNLAMDFNKQKSRRKKRFVVPFIIFISILVILLTLRHLYYLNSLRQTQKIGKDTQNKILEAFHELTEQNAPIEAPEGETKSECAVCLGNFEAGDKVRPLPPCEHIFHTECIELWLKKHNNCPLCRAEIFKISSGKVKPNVKEAPNAEARSNTENAAENNV